MFEWSTPQRNRNAKISFCRPFDVCSVPLSLCQPSRHATRHEPDSNLSLCRPRGPTNQKPPPRFQLALRDVMLDEPGISILYPRRCVGLQPHDRQNFAHPSRETPRRAGICSLHQRRCPNGGSHPLSVTADASGHFPHFCTEGGPICSKVCHGTVTGPTVDVVRRDAQSHTISLAHTCMLAASGPFWNANLYFSPKYSSSRRLSRGNSRIYPPAHETI